MEGELPLHNSSHLEQVRDWLEENVLDAHEAKVLQMLDVQVEWDRFPQTLGGDFQLVVDGRPYSERFRFKVDITGQPVVYPPMFHSPLGAPASYAQVDLTDAAYETLRNALTSLLPPVRPLNREQRHSTPVSKRMDVNFSSVEWKESVLRDHASITLEL